MPTPQLRDKILHRRSPIFSKRPQVSDIDDGELALNYNAGEPGLYFKDVSEDGETRSIRKIGPIHVGPNPPNELGGSTTEFPVELSNGECWIDTSLGEDKYILKTWNSTSEAWIEVSEIYGKKTGNLDQFADGEDEDGFIHTNGIRLKINNKTALAGFSTLGGDKLIINENNEFFNGVELNGKSFLLTTEEIQAISQQFSLTGETIDVDGENISVTGNDVVFKPHQGYTFTTDSIDGFSNTKFNITSHGFFDGEKIYVFGTLSNGTTPSPVPAGEYFVHQCTVNSFRLKDANGNTVNSTGNIYLAYSPEVILDRNRNFIQAGNFGLKTVNDLISSSSNQLEDKYWDVFYNPNNKNIRVFARLGNDVEQIQTSILSVDVMSGESSGTINPGDPVYYIGKDLATKLPKVGRAEASESNKMSAIGLANQSIAPGSRGSITILGEISGINTTTIDSLSVIPEDNIGKVVFVGSNGGLTLLKPNSNTNVVQPIGLLMRLDSTDGAIMVNHPSSFSAIPDLPEDYIWAGATNNEIKVHYLSPTSFERTYDSGTGIWTFRLADNLEFGAYRFVSDGSEFSKVETNVSSESVSSSTFTQVDVERFGLNYRSAKYIVQVSGTNSGGLPIYQIGEILVIHNGTSAFLTEYGMVSTLNDERLGQFDAYVDTLSSEVVLTFQKFANIVTSLEIKAVRTSILV